MLVSHRKNFIYTKTYKTAGTSVESYFEQHCMNEGEWGRLHARPEHVSAAGIIGCRAGDLQTIQAAVWWSHMPAITIKRLLGDDIWFSYFKFCVIRNPFDKAVSAFHFFKHQRTKQIGAAGWSGNSIAGNFENPPHPDLKQEFENWLTSYGPPIDRNKYLIDGVFCLDDVIRFENLPEDINRICEKLEVQYDPQHLPEFKSGHGRTNIPLRGYFSEKSVEIIAHTYKFELENFNYSTPL